MIVIDDKTECCGCAACANICPKKCITMKADEEGFLYPFVDQKTCVHCGQCEKVCPILQKPITFPVLSAYAAKNIDEEIQLKSSSGGVFSALAAEILRERGVVFGAAFNEDWSVGHTYVEHLQDLDKLRRSKYVQSDIGRTYQQAKNFLEQDRKVLFTGTPCQIAGLRNYLGKNYEKLITVDIICHGVPSPAVWQKFLRENTLRDKIDAIDFRHKYFGWDSSFLKIFYADGTSIPCVPNLLRPLLNARKGLLFRRFYRLSFWISNLYERPSCHFCHFKGWNKMADFSMGDLWGIRKNYPTLYDNKGVSVLLVNTPKAQTLFPRLFLDTHLVDIGHVGRYNPYLLVPIKPHPKRAEFFRRYQTENFNKLVRELLKQESLLSRVKGVLSEIKRNLS